MEERFLLTIKGWMKNEKLITRSSKEKTSNNDDILA